MARKYSMDVNFEYYKIFYYVAKYNNFTKAANILHNSQPNITRAMNCLEQEVNCTLFIRTNRGAFLTPEGERLYTRVSAAMMQIQQAEEELAESVGLEHGSISIGASEIALNIYLLDRLKKFHIAYPGVQLKIYNHSTPQAISAVRSGETDFAVITTPADVEAPLKEVRLKAFKDILIGGRTFTAMGSQVSLYLSGKRNNNLSFLQPALFKIWRGDHSGYRGSDDRSGAATCQK